MPTAAALGQQGDADLADEDAESIGELAALVGETLDALRAADG